MHPATTLFVSLFTTLLAIINPLEAIPVYLGLVDGKADGEQRRVARKACFYATLLCFFFLFFGTLLLRLFDVPLSMIRVVGGVILTRVGFELFSPSPAGGLIPKAEAASPMSPSFPWPCPSCLAPGPSQPSSAWPPPSSNRARS